MMYRIFITFVVVLLGTLARTQPPNEPESRLIMQHDGVVTAATWNPDAAIILTASEDSILRLWDAASGDILQQYQLDSPARGAVWHPDGARILTWTDTGQVTIIDRTANAESAPVPHNLSQVNGTNWLDDNRVVIWGDVGVYIDEIIDMEWRGEPVQLSHESSVIGLNLSDDDTHVYTFTEAGTAIIWNARSGDQLAENDFGGEALGIVWAEDETKYVVWGLYGSAVLVDTANRRRYNLSHRTFVNGARFNSDETRIMTWAADDRVTVWNASNGTEILTLVHNDWVNGARWNRDETRILSWAFDVVWLWDAESGALLARLPHENLVNGASFHPQQETQVLTWGWDGTARVWDVASIMPPQAGDQDE